MANALISYINYSEYLATAISATNATATMPAGNLALPALGKRLRVTGTSTVITFDFGTPVPIDVMALSQPADPGLFVPVTADGRGNYSGWMAATDTVRHQLDTVTPGAGALYDSGVVAGSWTAGYGFHLAILPARVTARYWTVTLSAPSLAGLGYVDLSRAWAGPKLTLGFNFGFNWSDATPDLTAGIRVGRSGLQMYDLGTRYRTLVLGFPTLLEAEAKSVIKEMKRVAGLSGMILLVPDPSSIYAPVQALIGRLQQVNPITQTDYAQFSDVFTVDQAT